MQSILAALTRSLGRQVATPLARLIFDLQYQGAPDVAIAVERDLSIGTHILFAPTRGKTQYLIFVELVNALCGARSSSDLAFVSEWLPSHCQANLR
jgi:hypothetical protein